MEWAEDEADGGETGLPWNGTAEKRQCWQRKGKKRSAGNFDSLRETVYRLQRI